MRNWERQIASIYWGWQMPGRSGLANIPTHLTKRFKLTAAGGDVCTAGARRRLMKNTNWKLRNYVSARPARDRDKARVFPS